MSKTSNGLSANSIASVSDFQHGPEWALDAPPALTTVTDGSKGICKMHCTTLPQQKSTTFFSLSTLPDPVEIFLQGIIVEKGRLFVFLTDGQRNRTFEPQAKTLVSFRYFQHYLLDKLNVLVSHRSQDSPSSRRRRDDWEAALQVAFDRGMAR